MKNTLRNRVALCFFTAFMAFSLAVPVMMRAGDTPDTRKEKIRLILRTQDLRSPHDASLRKLLYDSDTLVRQRAVLAYGSIQDTAVLPDLLDNLTNAPLQVQEAAAFAIGQTAALLGPASLGSMEHDIVWVRLDHTLARGRMIEELGKFGTVQALTELMLRFGTTGVKERESMLMSIARFGIRKITTPEAVRFALDALLDGGRDAWVAAYALQRIGEHAESYRVVARLVPLARHPDPLVRMNLAALLGKLKSDSTVVDVLTGIADFDSDWRVRVNALKALGNFPPDVRVLESIRRELTAGNPSVVITALSVLAKDTLWDVMGVRDPGAALVDHVIRMAVNANRGYSWQVQVGAAKALARIRGEAALEFVRVPDDPERLLLAGMIEALGATASVRAESGISKFLDAGDPLLWRASLEALHAIAARHADDAELTDRAYAADIGALSGKDMAVTTTAAANLGDSLYSGKRPVPALILALGNLRPPADIEPIQEICRTLSRIGDTSAVPALESLLMSGDDAAALAAAGALSAITGEDHLNRIPRDREPSHTDFDFEYLEALPDTIRITIGTNKGDILIDLYRDVAPFTIMSILRLAEEEGYYTGLIFHRVVPNFVIQGGDPRGDGWGGPGYSLRSEFSPLSYTAGTVGIASAGKDTEGSQFFITHSPQPHLDGRYTIIGQVVSGMETVDGIQVGDRMFDVARGE